MKQLATLVDRGHLAPIDLEFAGLLVRRASSRLAGIDEVRVVGLTAALLSAERGRGHSCIDLAALAGTAPWPDAPGMVLPDAAAWREILARSGACGAGDCLTPLVLDGDRLYLYRFHAAEQRLAAAVRARLVAKVDDAAPARATVALFRRLFPDASGSDTDWQAVAAAAALRSRLSIVTGGPGTGKTTAVARILALLLQREPDLRIALAAPTGKAAARLVESIRTNADRLDVDDTTRQALPAEGHTLHRLLGYQPWNDVFRHGPDRPLAEDVVVVDEASMVDLLLMDALFAAVRPSARIILLGDPDQLVSVDTGYVLGDICRAADTAGERHGAALGAWYASLSGGALPASPEPQSASPLRDAVVRLRRSYRFERQPGIGALATAVRAGDAPAARAALADERLADVGRRDPERTIAELVAPVVPLVESYLDARTPAEALERLSAFRVLCALREGPAGVAGLNEAMERWLRGLGLPTRARWYHGRPVLVTANDPATALFNGDFGVTFEEGGRMQVWFPDARHGVRAVPTTRLPAHETAWAMTVHKAQGSEFDHVLLVMPGEDHRVLTRELLYTGVTRARRAVDLVAPVEVLDAAIARTTTRSSGLAALLAR